MAVTKLKMMGISGNMRDFDSVLYMSVNDPYMHIEDTPEIVKNKTGFSFFTEQNPYRTLLSEIDSLASDSNTDLGKKTVGYLDMNKFLLTRNAGKASDFINQALRLDLKEAEKEIRGRREALLKINADIQEQTSQINEDNMIIQQLIHLGDISANINDFFNFEYFKFRFGHLPKEAYDSLRLYSTDEDDFFFIVSSVQKNEVWGMYFTPVGKSVRIDSLFRSLHFERVRISDRVKGTPEQAIDEIRCDIDEARARISEYSKKKREEEKKADAVIEKYYEKILILAKMFELRKKAVRTRSSFYIIEWIPEDYADTFIKNLSQLPVVVTPVDAGNDDIADVKPPTLLRNPAVFRPFEQFTEMYGLPSYNEIDPTPFVAVSYILFFGIMFGDLGQGFVISALGFALWFIKKINLARIIGLLGLSSMAFGIFFGSVFGFEDIIHGFNPIDHINTVLLAAIGLGVISVSGAIIINIVNGIRQKNLKKILFSHNGIAGLLLYWGIVVSALLMFNFLPFKISMTLIAVFIVLMAALIYLREPLSNLIQKKSEIIEGSKIEFFMTNIFELLEILLSFATNTISFIRVGVFALNHVGMMSVVMMLSRTVNGGTNIFVVIVGNVLVIALEGMIVGIQCLRLEYYEIFSRFYEGGGRQFEHSAIISHNRRQKGKK